MIQIIFFLLFVYLGHIQTWTIGQRMGIYRKYNKLHLDLNLAAICVPWKYRNMEIEQRMGLWKIQKIRKRKEKT